MEVSIPEFLNKYCLWIYSGFWECSKSNHIENEDNKSNKQESFSSKPRRTPRFKSLNFQFNLQRLIEYLDFAPNNDSITFNRYTKSTHRINASSKRTSYFGVNKNGPNWQTLITVNWRKTYVGTFMTEVEAAKVYDFFSMLLNLNSAKTNFNYTKEQAMQLISEFSYLIS